MAVRNPFIPLPLLTPQPAQSPGYVDTLNTIVSQAQQVLLDFVEKNPESWAPIISAWAIELLGQISSEYSQHCARSKASLQDLFQVCRIYYP